jgi:hypothetical protein
MNCKTQQQEEKTKCGAAAITKCAPYTCRLYSLFDSAFLASASASCFIQNVKNQPQLGAVTVFCPRQRTPHLLLLKSAAGTGRQNGPAHDAPPTRTRSIAGGIRGSGRRCVIRYAATGGHEDVSGKMDGWRGWGGRGRRTSLWVCVQLRATAQMPREGGTSRTGAPVPLVAKLGPQCFELIATP